MPTSAGIRTEEDAAYFYARAERELVMARQAVAPAASKAHYVLAGHYLDRVYSARFTHRPQSAGR